MQASWGSNNEKQPVDCRIWPGARVVSDLLRVSDCGEAVWEISRQVESQNKRHERKEGDRWCVFVDAQCKGSGGEVCAINNTTNSEGMMAKKKARRPKGWRKFHALTRKLIQVPKDETDRQIES